MNGKCVCHNKYSTISSFTCELTQRSFSTQVRRRLAIFNTEICTSEFDSHNLIYLCNHDIVYVRYECNEFGSYGLRWPMWLHHTRARSQQQTNLEQCQTCICIRITMNFIGWKVLERQCSSVLPVPCCRSDIQQPQMKSHNNWIRCRLCDELKISNA